MATQTLRRYPLDSMLAIEKRLAPEVRTALETELRLTGTMHMIQTELQSLLEQQTNQKADGGGQHGHGGGGFGGRHGGGYGHGGNGNGRHRHPRGHHNNGGQGGGGMQRHHPMRQQHTHGHGRRGDRQQGHDGGFERRGGGEERRRDDRGRDDRRHHHDDDMGRARHSAPTDNRDADGHGARDGLRGGAAGDSGGGQWGRARRPTHGTKGDSAFQKEFRLILNSLIETNQEDICKRLGALCRKHLLDDAQDDETREATVTFMANALVQAAQLQALYSPHYVAVVLYLCTKVFVDAHTDTYGAPLEAAIRTHSYERELENLSKPQAKGYAKFVTHLHLAGMADREALEAWAQRVIAAATGAFEPVASELLVWFGLELAKYNEVAKAKWEAYVTEHVGPLWADDGPLGMRARIRLMDVRDAFG